MATENLFLLEFLVDRLCLESNNLQRDKYAGLCMENCVTFEFLGHEPLDICEADFAPKRDYTDGDMFKSGKSILFSLSSEQAEKAQQDFSIHVTVYKKFPNNKMPDRIPIGMTDIQIVNQFSELIKQISAPSGDPQTPGTASKVIKDSYTLTDPSADGKIVGSICIFVRLSCFGKMVVTQFQMNLQDKSVMLKDNQGSSMYRYRKSQRDTMKAQPTTGTCDEWDRALGFKRSPINISRPCGVPVQPPCLPPPPVAQKIAEPPDDRAYQEIGAEMNGNALTIRVLKNKPKKSAKSTNDDDSCCCCCDDQTKTNGNGDEMPAITAIPEGPNPPTLNFKVNNNCCGGNQHLKVDGPRTNGAMQMTEMSDPHRDVFVLRIGKKTEGAEKKSNLELELRTPKGLDRKPVPKYESRDVQYDEADYVPKGGPLKLTAAKKKGGRKKK